MDIDIDIAQTEEARKLFNIVTASQIESGNLKKHNAGVYFQNMPKDYITGLAAIPYKEAEDNGYLKIDFLHLSFLDTFSSKKQIKALLKRDPDWDLLEDKKVVKKLFHIGKHFDIVSKVKPRSIEQLSDILAIIRPSKIKLLNKYLKNPDSVRTELYTKRQASDMRKSHTIPYSMIIVLQMHLIKADIL